MLTIALATRGRPSILTKTLHRTLSNIREPSTRLVVLLDEDDAPTLEAPKIDHPQLFYSTAPREDSLGAKYNRVLDLQGGVIPNSVYLVMVDYAPHITPGFDARLLKAADIFDGAPGLVVNNLANATFPGINAFTSSWVQAIGYIYPPFFPYWFVDHWVQDVAEMTSQWTYCPTEIDTSARPGTQSRRDFLFWANFYRLTSHLRERDAIEILASTFDGWRNEPLLTSRWPIIHQRSTYLYKLMAQEGIPDLVPDDARHQQLRKLALELIKHRSLQKEPTS